MKIKNCTPVLFVKDAVKSAHFYEKVLGMTITSNFGDLNFSFKEGFAIWQILEQNIIPQTLGMDNITNSESISRFELCFETEDLDNIYNSVKEQNTKFLHEINEELWGQRTIRFYDPDGHLIEIGEALHVFLERIYKEENENLEATSKRTYVPIDALKQFLGL